MVTLLSDHRIHHALVFDHTATILTEMAGHSVCTVLGKIFLFNLFSAWRSVRVRNISCLEGQLTRQDTDFGLQFESVDFSTDRRCQG